MVRFPRRFFPKLTALCFLLMFLLMVTHAFSEEGTSEIRGKVLASDARTPIAGATVKAYHIASGKLFNSIPTDASGSYSLKHLPYGYYDIAVETEEGLFISTQALNIAPNTKTSISFAISSFEEQPAEWWEGKEKPQIPVLKKESTGIARILEKKGAKAFFKSGKGVATILAGSAAAIGIAIAAGGDDGRQSPY
ncbi:MAG: carboxypeptidase-like regulatory domain-containing protein [Acidobacteriota bacterium]